MWMLTEERKNELLKQREAKLTELDTLKKKTPSDLWREDLDVFLEKLDVVEKKEQNEQATVISPDMHEAKKNSALVCMLMYSRA